MTKPDWLKNFELSDFACRCPVCQRNPYPVTTVIPVIRAVQDLRTSLGIPLTVTRGVSCAAHNRAVGGADHSRHLPEYADAVDILAPDPVLAHRIVRGAMSISIFNVFRVYGSHVHLDARPGPSMFLASPEC